MGKHGGKPPYPLTGDGWESICSLAKPLSAPRAGLTDFTVLAIGRGKPPYPLLGIIEGIKKSVRQAEHA